jgi:hypothetical protein
MRSVFLLTLIAALPAICQDQPAAAPKMAEDVYKNIQIFKGVPAARLPDVMKNFSRWLGVSCDTCHVPKEFEKDDKPQKVAARRMMLMVRKIGQDNFGDRNPVTCWMCHRGSLKPESMPQQPAAN